MQSVVISSGDSQNLSAQKLSAAVRLATIEAGRATARVTQATLAAQAGMSERTYRYLLAGGDSENIAGKKLSARIVRLGRLERALAHLRALPRLNRPEADLIRSTYRGFVLALAADMGVTPDMVEAADPQLGATADPIWRACSHVRQAAIYLANTTLGLKQRRLAEVMGLTPAAVCLALKAVEDRRDDPAFDALLARAARTITGRNE